MSYGSKIFLNFPETVRKKEIYEGRCRAGFERDACIEIKVKRFQERGQRRKSYILGHVSTENSLSINYRINDESKSDLL